MMRSIINSAVGLQNKEGRAKKLNDVNPNELTVGDFFMFLNRYNQGVKNKQETILYDQAIAVFSDKSRRYYIESIAAHDARTRKLLLSKIERNPAYKGRYQGKEGEAEGEEAEQLQQMANQKFPELALAIDGGKEQVGEEIWTRMVQRL